MEGSGAEWSGVAHRNRPQQEVVFVTFGAQKLVQWSRSQFDRCSRSLFNEAWIIIYQPPVTKFVVCECSEQRVQFSSCRFPAGTQTSAGLMRRPEENMNDAEMAAPRTTTTARCSSEPGTLTY